MPWDNIPTFIPCCDTLRNFLRGLPYYDVTPTKKGIEVEGRSVRHLFFYCPFCGEAVV